MAGWVKALLFLFGGAGAAAGTAYVTGALDPWLAPKPPEVSGLLQAPDAAAPQDAPAVVEDEAEAEPEAAAPETPAEDPATTPKTDRLAAPVFDVLRVEPDGSVLIAGKASANAQVEVLFGDTVLGKGAAGPGGDFVVVLDETLKPGDYRLALRATSPEGETALSEGTAIVSIPEAENGQVLAMVEEPGQPAELISVPQGTDEEPAPEAAAEEATPEAEQDEAAAPQDEAPAEAAEVAAPEAEEDEAAPEPEAEAVAEAPAEEPAAPAAPIAAVSHTVSVEAVEIEGDTIFVAGRADAGRTVRVYAGTVLLGDAVASEGGRFLVEAKRHLDVGNYLIRADLLGDDGSVVARAGVPFEREPGEAIAAVAPAAPPQPGPAQPEQAAAEEEPQPEAEAEVAAAPAEPAGGEDEATAPPLQRVDGAVIIRRGDSLWRISRRVYGHGIRYSTIYLANQDQIHDPNRIWPGQVFAVPGETPEGEQADLDAIGEQAVKPEERETTTAQ